MSPPRNDKSVKNVIELLKSRGEDDLARRIARHMQARKAGEDPDRVAEMWLNDSVTLPPC
jgi:hypothetical protein